MVGGKRALIDVHVRPMHANDLEAADAVRRLAFGTFLGLPDPMSFRGDANPTRTRYLADPAGSFVAELDGRLVGSNHVIGWGSVGFFGPLSVHPDYWNRGVARRLVAAVIDEMDRRGVHHIGLFTFAQSEKHTLLYQKFGFWPHFLTPIMVKPVGRPKAQIDWIAFSRLSAAEQGRSLDACRSLTNEIHSGLDLTGEIETIAAHGFGETILLRDEGALIGFAACHCGGQTEAGFGRCYVKFGAVRSGPAAGAALDALLAGCEAYAAEAGLERLVAGVNTARREAYRGLLAAGFRAEVIGLTMHRPDEPAYNRPGAWVIDDWR